MGAFIPGLGRILGIPYAVLQYYIAVYGGFCVYSTINNVTWVVHL